jgi:hypothetical protein
MSYSRFKMAVVRNAGYACENPYCESSEHLTVHHFLKQSTYPEFAEDVDNGMCACGPCHSEIERRQREGGDYVELYPVGRYRHILAKAGIEVPEGMEDAAALQDERLDARRGQLRLGL